MNSKAVLSGKIEARFGWDAFPRQYSGGLISGLRNSSTEIDYDAGALLYGDNGKPISPNVCECFLNYAAPDKFDSSLLHHGDNQTGFKKDDEIISIVLPRIPKTVNSIFLTLDIFKEKKKIGTGKIQNTFVRIIDTESGEELARSDVYNLDSGSKLVVVGELLRLEDGRWLFKSLEEAHSVNRIEDFIETFL